MIGSKVEGPAAALPHLVFLHLSLLCIKDLLHVTCNTSTRRQKLDRRARWISSTVHLSASQGITNLKVGDQNSEGDVVGTEVLLHKPQAGAGHTDVNRKLSGDWVEPEVQLKADRHHEVHYWLNWASHFKKPFPKVDINTAFLSLWHQQSLWEANEIKSIKI